MRIFLVHYYGSKPNPAYEQIGQALRRRGHTVWIAQKTAAGDIQWSDGSTGVGIVDGPAQLPSFVRGIPIVRKMLERLELVVFVLRLQTFINRYSPDIVQVNPAGLLFFWLLPLLSKLSGRPKYVIDWRQIAQHHPTGAVNTFYIALRDRWRRWISSNLFDAATFLHPYGAIRFFGQGWQRSGTVVPLGIGDGFLTVSTGDVPKQYEGDRVYFLYIGSLSRVRKLECLIEAADQLRRMTENFHVTLVGPDNSQRYFHQLVEELNLGKFVTIHPPVEYDKIPQFIAEHHVALAYVPDSPADWQFHPTLKILEYRADRYSDSRDGRSSKSGIS